MADAHPFGQDLLCLPAVTPDLWLDRSVAIVGSSSGLRDAGHGADIDAHAEVIRFNGAITEGYEADAGSRTTLQVIGLDIAYLFNPKYLRPTHDPDTDERHRHENARRIAAYFPDARFLTFHPDDPERNARNRQYMTARYLQAAAPDRPVWHFAETGPGSAIAYYTANRDLEALGLERRLRHGGPRTGVKMVLRCVLAGLRPKLFGFDVDVTAETARHYHDDVTNERIGSYKAHDVLGEMEVLLELRDRGLIDIAG